VETTKLETTDAFVVVDLEGAERAVGVVRLAPKILVDGAVTLARSSTYEHAVFERPISGASGGINAKPDGRDEAVKAFVEEIGDRVRAGGLCLDPAKGLTEADFEPLTAADARVELARTAAPELTAAGVVAATDATLGGLDGRTVAIEGLDAVGVPAVEALRGLSAAGAEVMVVGTSAGTAVLDTPADPAALADGWAEHGAGIVGQLVAEPGPAWRAIGAEVDILLVGSKAGVLTHDNTGHVRADLVVPVGRVPVTAKALAELRRQDTVVLPDFVTLAGPGLVAWHEPTLTDVGQAVSLVDEAVRSVLGEVGGHEQGPLLAACYRAEAFLHTWRDTLPFGRPLA
jgi:glutamate dehydrogenase/leucine dehydrogenase